MNVFIKSNIREIAEKEHRAYSDSHHYHWPVPKSGWNYRMAEPEIDPSVNDVLMGRGGKNNAHSGNVSGSAAARWVCNAQVPLFQTFMLIA